MKKVLHLTIFVAFAFTICLALCGCMDKETKAAVDAFDQEADRITQQMNDLDELISSAESGLTEKGDPQLKETLQEAMDDAKEAEAEITIPECPEEVEAINAETEKLKEITLKEELTEMKEALDVFHENQKEFTVGKYDGSLGSAGEITEDTIVVSIFVKDRETRWDDESEKEACLDRLSQATAYLEKEVGRFARTPHFYYDWSKDESLVFDADINANFSSGLDYYDEAVAYIKENIDPVALKKDHKAENIVYMFFINSTYEDNSIPPTTRSWDTFPPFVDQIAFSPEVMYIFSRYTSSSNDKQYDADEYDYAHEIMHTFGAEDLYVSGNKIRSGYVEYCRENKIDDIMYGAFDWYPFTEIDAYYLGLTDHADDVEKFDLGKSEHSKD